MSDKAVVLGSQEWSALAGLPYLQRCLYMILRWYMDRTTGRVGDTRGISYQSLGEELYVEPVRGRHASECGAPTVKAVRSALGGLEKAGLIRPCGNGEVLVFFLPKARRALARSKDEGQMRGRVDGHDDGHRESGMDTRFSGDDGHDDGQRLNGYEGHTSRKGVNPLSVEATAAALRPDLSTDSMLQLPLDTSAVSEWVRIREGRRGCAFRVGKSASRISEWIVKGVRPDELRLAYADAVNDRVDTKNRSPINLQFLDIFVNRVLEGRGSARSGGVQPLRSGRSVLDIASARAEELGIKGRQQGESDDAFVGRVSSAWEASQLGIPGQREGEPAGDFMARLSDARRAGRRGAKRVVNG